MAQHKKRTVFIRVITSNHTVTCINPLQLSSFQIIEKAPVKVRKEGTTFDPKDPRTYDMANKDTVRFYFPQGTGLSYSVDVDFSQEEFNYVCATLQEFLYLNEAEFQQRIAEANGASIADWNDTMAAPVEGEVK